MKKPRIPARLAVEDIRSGMDDSDLMKKYNVSPKGLRSLFSKLIAAGLIDQSEIDERVPEFVGTVILSEDLTPPVRHTPVQTITVPPETQTPPKISARQALHDIKSGMSDLALIEKYQLSAKGLESLFRKLTENGLIAQSELDRRIDSFEATVDLSDTIDQLGYGTPTAVTEIPSEATSGPGSDSTVEESVPAGTQADVKAAPKDAVPKDRPRPAHSSPSTVQPYDTYRADPPPPWYNKPVVVWGLLIFVFPLGFYALYRNTRLTSKKKAFTVLVWIALVLGGMFVLAKTLEPDPYAQTMVTRLNTGYGQTCKAELTGRFGRVLRIDWTIRTNKSSSANIKAEIRKERKRLYEAGVSYIELPNESGTYDVINCRTGESIRSNEQAVRFIR